MNFKRKSRNIRALIVLLAAFITLLLNMKYEREIVKSLTMVLVVIVVFYVIATVAIKLVDIISRMDDKTVYDDGEEASEETVTEEQDGVLQ